MFYKFHIETEDVLKIQKDLEGKGVQFKKESLVYPNLLIPHYHHLQNLDLVINEGNLKKFLEVIKCLKEKMSIFIYECSCKEKSEGIYKPFLLPDEKNPLFPTLFLYQMLAHPKEFLEKSQIPFSTFDAENFLETIKITQKQEKTLNGYYKSIACQKESTFVTSTDTGLFQLQYKKEMGDHKIVSQIENIHEVIKTKTSLYENLFPIASKSGQYKWQISEYYIPFINDSLLHFGENIDIVEVYGKKNNQRDNIPFYIFRKEKPQEEFERDALDAIKIFFNRQQRAEQYLRLKK